MGNLSAFFIKNPRFSHPMEKLCIEIIITYCSKTTSSIHTTGSASSWNQIKNSAGPFFFFSLYLKKKHLQDVVSSFIKSLSFSLSQFGCCIWENKYSSNMEIEQGKELLLEEPNLAWFVMLL